MTPAAGASDRTLHAYYVIRGNPARFNRSKGIQMRLTFARAGAIVLAVALAACSPMVMKKDASLYERLGGKTAITAVVDDFIGNVAVDTRINGRFGGTNIPRLKQLLVDQICAASGGPCTYGGRDMLTTHRGMNISEAEFGALVGDLVKALDKFKVAEKEKGELLGALGGMKGDIVGR
jgi:hemoglobin